jgi:hypothetical protein
VREVVRPVTLVKNNGRRVFNANTDLVLGDHFAQLAASRASNESHPRGLAITHDKPYSSRMSERIDLADPSFEPTDEQLTGLSVRAFAGVAAAHRVALERLRSEIEAAREQVLRALEGRGTAPRET